MQVLLLAPDFPNRVSNAGKYEGTTNATNDTANSGLGGATHARASIATAIVVVVVGETGWNTCSNRDDGAGSASCGRDNSILRGSINCGDCLSSTRC